MEVSGMHIYYVEKQLEPSENNEDGFGVASSIENPQTDPVKVTR
jgi:hypothetical protein